MSAIQAIALVTDFGSGSPYVGQMKLLLAELTPGVPVIDLVSDVPPFRPDLAAYLLPALVRDVPARTLYLCVVDPGVGSDRAALAIEADGGWFVGPDNGILAILISRAGKYRVYRVDWRPEQLSHSFHGRDLFAPIAGMLIKGREPSATPIESRGIVGSDWPEDLSRVIYADHYGNLITGLRARSVGRSTVLQAGNRQLRFARTFSEVPSGTAFWYENSFGLVELAVNQGRADVGLGLAPGDPVTCIE